MTKLTPLLILLALFSIGCASPWEKSFQPNPLVPEHFAPTQQVQIRMVEFERLQNYERAEKQMRVASSTAPEDYTQAQRLAAKNRLLEALQLPDRGNSIAILGWSRFASTDGSELRGNKLADFAKSIGADVVVATTAYAGQINRVVDYPLSTYSNYYTPGRRGRMVTESSTTWVPTTVTENQYYYEAVFLRRQPQSQAASAATQSSQRTASDPVVHEGS